MTKQKNHLSNFWKLSFRNVTLKLAIFFSMKKHIHTWASRAYFLYLRIFTFIFLLFHIMFRFLHSLLLLYCLQFIRGSIFSLLHKFVKRFSLLRKRKRVTVFLLTETLDLKEILPGTKEFMPHCIRFRFFLKWVKDKATPICGVIFVNESKKS